MPGGSEAVLPGLPKPPSEQRWPTLAPGAFGNTLDGMTSYACGRWLPYRQAPAEAVQHAKIHVREKPEAKARIKANTQAWARRWGAPILIPSRALIIGEALCLAAGRLPLNPRRSALFMPVGRFTRPWLVAQGAPPS